MSLIFTVLLPYGSVVTLRYKTVTRGGLVDGLLLASITANFGFWTTGRFLCVCMCVLDIIDQTTPNAQYECSGWPSSGCSIKNLCWGSRTSESYGKRIRAPQHTSGLNKSWTSCLYSTISRSVPYCLLFRSDRLAGNHTLKMQCNLQASLSSEGRSKCSKFLRYILFSCVCLSLCVYVCAYVCSICKCVSVLLVDPFRYRLVTFLDSSSSYSQPQSSKLVFPIFCF